MATIISPQEAKRKELRLQALLRAQVPISTIARQEKVGRAMIYDIQRHLASGDPSDSLSSLSRKKRINLPKLVLEP